jgi:hypothetical protein
MQHSSEYQSKESQRSARVHHHDQATSDSGRAYKQGTPRHVQSAKKNTGPFQKVQGWKRQYHG